jgi:hypothetical protein
VKKTKEAPKVTPRPALGRNVIISVNLPKVWRDFNKVGIRKNFPFLGYF